MQERLAAGRTALAGGDFARAVQELDAAGTIAAAHPQQFSVADRRQLLQLQRQAAILANWMREPLDQALARAARLNDDEWLVVVERYRGKTVVFDLEIRRDPAGQYQVKPARPGTTRLRVEVQELKLLRSLPLDAPQRVLFAARLAEVRRNGPESCTVQLDPTSGVLLTDVSSAAICGEIPEATLQTILRQQRGWAAELPEGM
jgi:hypothetical protein